MSVFKYVIRVILGVMLLLMGACNIIIFAVPLRGEVPTTGSVLLGGIIGSVFVIAGLRMFKKPKKKVSGIDASDIEDETYDA